MKYTYNLFNPLDYLYLLFLAFFNRRNFPEPKERRKQLIVIVQKILVIVGISVVVGWWTGEGEFWKLFIFSVLIFIAIAILIIGTGLVFLLSSTAGIEELKSDKVTTSIMSVIFYIVISVLFYRKVIDLILFMLLDIIHILTLIMILGIADQLPFSIVIGISIGAVIVSLENVITNRIVGCLVDGIIGGTIVGITVGILKTVSGIWGWFAGLGVTLIAGLIIFGIGLVLSLVLSTLIWKIPFKSYSIVVDMLRGVVLLLLLSLGVGYLFNFLSHWLIALEGIHPLWISLIFFLVLSRFHLWLIEGIIGLTGYMVNIRLKQEPVELFRSVRRWFFDYYVFLPFPYEAQALSQVTNMDQFAGTYIVIRMLKSSNHLQGTVSALRSVARVDPYGILASIYTLKKGYRNLFQYTFYKQPEEIIHAHVAYEKLIELRERLDSKNKDKEEQKVTNLKKWLEQQRPLLRKLLGKQLIKFSNTKQKLTREEVIVELNQITKEMKKVNQLAKKGRIHYVEEMVNLWTAIEDALGYSEINQIADFHAPILPQKENPILFPESLIETLTEMNELAVTITTYNHTTTQVTQQRILLETSGKLVSLEEQTEKLPQPEKAVLKLVVSHWRHLILAAGGELVRIQDAEPVDNPYVIANPVIGDLFVGRDDIMQRLEELWVGEGQKPSVVLYGHRRMGKSSILDNLGARFGAQTIIVDFNMQREGMVESSGELLYNLALAMYDTLPTPGPSQEGKSPSPNPSHQGRGDLPEPEEEQFTAHNPYTTFNRFLKRLDQVRGENRFIITVDEFELVEELIDKGIVEARLLDFWRSLIQTYPWFVMALAGLHTLQEMTEDYWNPLFASVIGIQVSFLRPAAARKLITQPTPDFPIDYDQDAIDTIITLTNGQPYLVQLICHGLVTRFNRQRFEEGIERERRFSLEDVETVINAPEFFRDGNAYFTGVWVQAEKSEPTGQTQVLRALAESETGKSAEEIARGAGLTLEEVHVALETLARHDVVKKENDRWHFTVELMRRWVVQKAI